jgi:phosphoribosylformimino-5-aminoimidazole carboxamide ribotide isomerase
MIVIPAIDLKDGKCVRLKQGIFSDKKVYADDPVAVALSYQEAGAKRLHLIDLDGAESGVSKNVGTITGILDELTIPVQIGGGIRSVADIGNRIALGADRVIVSTLAVKSPDEFKKALKEFGTDRLILAVDARNGKVAIRGWQEEVDITATDLALEFKEDGLQRVLYTDIARDGMFTGPNIAMTKELAIKSGLKVIASGGISGLQDLDALRQIELYGIDSVVVGKAFYEGKIKPEDVF